MIGKQFLERVLLEKKEVEQQVPAQFKADAGTERLKMMLRDVGGEDDLADKIAEVLNCAGVPGSYLNKAEVKDAILDAATLLRGQRSRKGHFLNLHSMLTAFCANNPVKKSSGGSAVVAKGEVGEKDLGTGFQEIVAEVLASLGAPEVYFTKDAPAAMRTSFKSSVMAMQKDAAIKAAFQALARSSRIRKGDGKIGSQVTEEVQDDPEAIRLVKEVMMKLGVMASADDKIIKLNPMWEQSVKSLIMKDQKLKMAMKSFLKRVG